MRTSENGISWFSSSSILQIPLFLRKISFLSCLISAFKVKLLLDVLNLVSVSFMAVLILGLFFKTPAGLSLFSIQRSFQSFSKI